MSVSALRAITQQPSRPASGRWAVSVLALGFLLLPLSGQVTRGNAAAGKALFEGKGGCMNCHVVADHGGSLGQDLSKIGITRSPESLRLAVLDPDAEIATEYRTLVLTTKSGQTVRGIVLNQDDLSVQLRDTDGYPRSFLRQDLKSEQRELKSLMPSYASRLSTTEIDDLMAYLRTLRGPDPGPARLRQPHHSYSDVSFLDRIGRDAEERPDSLLNSLQIPANSTVGELGTGTGYFTWRLAQKVGPGGKVFAVDVQQAMLDKTAENLKQRQLNNVQLILGSESDPHLPAASLDLVLIANAYHEFSKPADMINAVKRALKTDGRLVIVEYAEGVFFGPSDRADRMTVNQIRAEIEPLGFQLDRELETQRIEHALVFSKVPSSGN